MDDAKSEIRSTCAYRILQTSPVESSASAECPCSTADQARCGREDREYLDALVMARFMVEVSANLQFESMKGGHLGEHVEIS